MPHRAGFIIITARTPSRAAADGSPRGGTAGRSYHPRVSGKKEMRNEASFGAGRVGHHPVLETFSGGREVVIFLDGEPVAAREGEPVAAALYAAGMRTMRRARRGGEPRGPFCMIGRCTECCMTVDGVSNVRTCRTPVREGMRVETQRGEPRS